MSTPGNAADLREQPLVEATASTYSNSTNTTRRHVLAASLVLLAAACAERAELPRSTLSHEPPADPVFLALSRTITGHDDLDALTAARLSSAFAAIAPPIHTQILALGRVLRSDMSPEDALAAADQADLKAIALTVVAAWYTGTAGSGLKAVTVSYRDALMQRPVADALSPPTYALGGPAWWTAEPPPVGLSRPVARAPAPPTVGNPEPKPQ